MPGHLFVIAAPSGAGKTSLVKALLEREPGLALSISHTTRKPRPTETPGLEYHFVAREDFEAMRADGVFLESAQVFDNFYGTSRHQLDAHRDAGRDVVLEIDWQGARQVRIACPECLSIFILPPSRDALRSRLQARRTDSPEVIERRLADAVGDMSHYGEFDAVIVNEVFEQAVADLQRIVHGGVADFAPGREALKPVLRNLLD
jgi:guanylate kinase